MPVSSLSSVAQDYLKVIWCATEWEGDPITVKQLAERMGVRAATVSDGIRRLADQGLLAHEPYGGIELTDAGRHGAVAMVRRHRLIETFLVEELGYGWDEVHDEAEVLEHAVSDELIDRIDRRLGYPARDPHGDPIPTADGTPRRADAAPLLTAQTGVALTVVRISDADPAILRYLGERGIGLDAEVTVDEHREFAGDVTVRLHGEPMVLGSTAAGAVWVATR
ncbi:DtxR family transcriptional regulator [Leifsonia xyli subsp. xyli]|uniref:Manganese transport regulator n=2 Tax=Leifsonia xyli subsp. xyli TaxID=59736 RepID=Q6AH05_LEIXX|nr:metal-dependent transcriptional regulator [Leifsonia xyli]AAT88340.1 iron-dependant repressor, DtxR metalloregulatory family [Leifsonia xyli subsp. xyli str. CTCB07]ODA89776.1 DtxR family transcriptional regulator [Leifsonia xyli subsp. xyli]